MDNPFYVIGGIAVIVFLISGPFIKRWTRRKGAQIGRQAGEKFAAHNIAKANEKVPEMLAQLGATLVIAAPEAQAREIVATGAAKKRKDFPANDDGTFGIRFTEPEDAVVALVPDPQGFRVQVERFREHFGYPMMMGHWATFQKNIRAAATAAGVPVTEGPVQSFTRGAIVSGNDAAWTREA